MPKKRNKMIISATKQKSMKNFCIPSMILTQLDKFSDEKGFW